MRRRVIRLAAVVAVVAAMSTTITPPARATGSTSIADADGVDFDAACMGRPFPIGRDSVASPGGAGCHSEAIASVYDGSTEATDIRSVSLASDTSGHLVATCELDGTFPEPGSTDLSDLDRPALLFNGVGCKVMFQNPAVQTYASSSSDGGCTQVGTGRHVKDRHGSWRDGFHFFLGFEAYWNEKWIHVVQQGEYDPSPSGGFIYTELGSNDGTGWRSSNPHVSHGTDWTVSLSGSGPTTVTITAPGLLPTPDPVNCAEGIFTLHHASDGDSIVNVKGVSSANVQGRDAAQLLFSDVTSGSSSSGMFGTNITGVAYSHGAWGWPEQREATDVSAGVSHFWDTGQRYGGSDSRATDTAGWNGQECPAPTAGGTLPESPTTTDEGCQVDDDNISRGSWLAEFWETPYSFVF